MAWILSSCPDPYGLCLRQYIFFALSVVTLLVCLYSSLRTLVQHHRRQHYGFQLLPLIINTCATVLLAGAASQYESENVYLTMLVLEVYSYGLLTYTYAGLYLVSTRQITQGQFRRMRALVVAVTVAALAAIVYLLVMQAMGRIKCRESHGLGNAILSGLELPLYAAAFVFVAKTKAHIRKLEQSNYRAESTEIKLLGDEDEYIAIRLRQANLMLASFSLSLLLHIGTGVMFWVVSTNCEADIITVQSLYELVMLGLFDLATLLPHVTIPVMLYFIPGGQSRGPVVMAPVPKLVRDTSECSDMINTTEWGSGQKIRDMAARRKNQDQHSG